MAKRPPLTVKMLTAWILAYADVRCYICNEPLVSGQRVQWDHVHMLGLEGPHEYQNLRPIHYDPCHKNKTRRDVKALRKADRIAGGGRKRKGPQMKSRGFRTDIKRRLGA